MIFYPHYYEDTQALNAEIQSKIQASSKEGSEEHQIVSIPGTAGSIVYQIACIVQTHKENIEKSPTIYILHTEADSTTRELFRGWVNILRDRIIDHASCNRSGRKIETILLDNTVASRAVAAAAPQQPIAPPQLTQPHSATAVAAAPPKPIAPPQPTHPYSVIEAIPSKQDLGAKTPLLSQPSNSKNCPCTIQ